MPNTELKPCPFCGGRVRIYWWDSDNNNAVCWEPCDDDEGANFPVVECHNCDSTVIFTGCGFGREVIEAWNRRQS